MKLSIELSTEISAKVSETSSKLALFAWIFPLLLLLMPQPSHAGAPNGIPSGIEKGCRAKDFKTLFVYQSDPQLLGRMTAQGHAGGCQHYVGYQLAQYFEYQQGGGQSVIPPGLPEECCENFRKDDQSTYALLQRLRIQDFGCEAIETISSAAEGAGCAHLKESLGKAVKDGFESPQTCSVSRTVGSTAETHKKRANLASYNIEFLETLSPQKNLERMRDYFKTPSWNLRFPLPVGFSFCEQELDSKKPCSSNRASLIAGVRKACCKNTCQEEWLTTQGQSPASWTPALPIAKAAAEFHGGMTRISPCKDQRNVAALKSDSHPQPHYPGCSEIIQGKYPLHYLAKAGDFATLQGQIRRYLSQINEFNNSDMTPLTLAAIGNSPQHAKTIEILLQNKADPNLEDASGMTPLHWALLNKTAIAPQLVSRLIQKGAVFMNKDGNLTTKIRDLAGKGNPASREVLERKRKEFFLNLHH